MMATYAYIALAVFAAVYLRFMWVRYHGGLAGSLVAALIAGAMWPVMIVALFMPKDRD